MKVKKLIKLLKKVDGDRLVIMSKDEEGNNFSPLWKIDDECNYEADSTYSGEIGLAELTPSLVKQGYTEADVRNGVPALVLWPTN